MTGCSPSQPELPPVSIRMLKPAQKHVCLSVSLSLRVDFIFICHTLAQILLSTSR